MNCKNFESAINDIARGALMDAASREQALAHAADCARCAARLSDERALTGGLRSLAAEMSAQEAPARVEAALVAAFRERAAAHDTSGAAATTKPVPLVSPRASSWWLPQWAQGAAVAAASVVLVFGLYVAFRNNTDTTHAPRASQANAHAPAGDAQPAPAQGETADAPGVANAPGGDYAKAQSEQQASQPPRAAGRAPAVRAGYQFANNVHALRPTPAAQPSEAADEEIVTEFIPLMNGGQLAPGDAGHLMRVEVPRSALASFGLPVNADRPGGRVKADVLMGEDGIARAIRFVR